MGEVILKVNDLNKTFVKNYGILGKKLENKVINGVSIEIKRGSTYGLVGESGSGKSTLARIIVGLLDSDSGYISIDDIDLAKLKGKEYLEHRKKIQMVFQNPMESLNPKMKIATILRESLILSGENNNEIIKNKIDDIIQEVGLGKSDLLKHPNSFSGGQAQRIAIARCLLSNPEMIIFDEAVSALDVSIQAQILNLLIELQEKNNYTYFFISHDLGVTRHISDKIGVMYLGRIVEEGETDDIFDNPLHPYTKMLLASVNAKNDDIEIKGEIPSQFAQIEGCAFYERCPYKMEKCKNIMPNTITFENRKISCHLYNE